jgi:Sulfotransferase family
MASQPSLELNPSPTAGRPKVIYVMGAGRSGTTILGVALGNCVDFVFAGELNQWLLKSGVPTHDGPERTRFWETVRGDLDGAAELFGGQATCLERSSALLNIRKWPTRRRLRRPYRRLAENLYRAIARTAEVTYVVDTSHYPLRARELQRIPGIDLYLLYVARSPHGVVASLDRDDVPERRFNMPTANAYLWLTHFVSVFAFLRHRRDRRLFVRHEDFITNPEAVLRQILDWSGSAAELPDLTSLQTGVPLHGNRLIASSVVALRRQSAQPERRSRMTALIQLPWAAIHSRLRPAARVEPAGAERARSVRRPSSV